MADSDIPRLIENRPMLLEDRPMLLQSDRPIISSIREALPDEPDEAIVEPRLAQQWTEVDLPFRGEVRERVAKRFAEDIRRRRTIDGLSSRVAVAAVTPITTELQNMATERIKSRLNQQAQRAIQSGGNE